MTTLALRMRSAGGPAVTGPWLRGPILAWAALFLNVMPFQGSSVLLIPHSLGQALSQGMLLVALVLALLANPGAVVRPNTLLALLMAMAVLAVAVGIHSSFPVGATYRALRLTGFVLVLWLLTPWWGRPELPLLRAHLLCLRVILMTTWLGAALAPGRAFATQGRMSGTIWPIPAPQVAHYAALLLGCTVVLWFCGVVGGRGATITVVVAGAALVATHTRTALLAVVFGLIVATASLFLAHARVRRTTAIVLVVGLTTWVAFSSSLLAWLGRGQSAEDLTQLTGRTKVWAAVADRQTTVMSELFGTGLSNKSFDGLAIDSTWVSTHVELGRIGVALVVALLLIVFLTAVTRPAGPRRAIALLIVVYCLTASFTETGLGDASPYVLDLVVAASLLATPLATRRPSVPSLGMPPSG